VFSHIVFRRDLTPDQSTSNAMKSGKWTDESKWIWLEGYDDGAPEGQIVLFRKKFSLSKTPTDPCLVKVSADTRYRLFINGISVSFGPCKSYLSRWYYETVDISPYLKQGPNVLHARVLRFPPTHPGNLSLIRGPFPGLILHCNVEVSLLFDPKLLRLTHD
jgi:alpha-L-rhamnosidase